MQDIAQSKENASRTILGVRIEDLSRDSAIALIDERLAAGLETKICFANAQALNVACDNPDFRKALADFVVLNDGLGTDLACRLKFGHPFTENLNGTDFVPDYLGRTDQTLRIYLVGTNDDTVARAAEVLGHAYPRHSVVGYRNGFFQDRQDIEQTCAEIRQSTANCLLVGMGNPLQELWIAEHGGKTGAKLFFGVGALLDFQAGRVPRAPEWLRSLRCEWIYRLAQEPRRLARRYLIGNLVFLGRVMADARR